MRNKCHIDEIDAKILRTLLTESRTSLTNIAKECKITVGAVRMRYKRLCKEGIVNGEMMLVNPHCLGYRHIIDLGIVTAIENEKEVAEFLERKPYISALVGPFGKYNFFGKVALTDLNKLGEIIEDLESNQYIKHVDSLIWSEAVNVEFPKNLVIKPLSYDNPYKNNQRTTLTNLNQAPVKFDDIDKQIALLLSNKSKTPFRKIGQQLGISTKTVIQRYKKLRENLLTLSTITVDLNKLGYNALAHFYLNISNRSKITEIYDQLLQIENLIVIIRLIGRYDLYTAIVLEDFQKLFEVSERIRRINGIQKAEPILTPVLPAWPLNLFPSLLQNEAMQPKYWPNDSKKRKVA